MLPSPEELKLPPYYHEMILVEGGTFMMGSDDEDSFTDSRPVHRVTVNAFLIGKYTVTQSLWKAVMGDNPSFFIGDSRPVETVNWDDVYVFIKKLNELTAQNFRLPSEAEWEFAALGGTKGRGYGNDKNACIYAGSDNIDEVGWHEGNSGGKTQPVGLKLPNELGLYDMTGNVWEWCQDEWEKDYNGAPIDGSAREENLGTFRIGVCRGGSFEYYPEDCRPSYRDNTFWDHRGNSVGFRLAAGLPR